MERLHVEEVLTVQTIHGKGTEQFPYYTSDDYFSLPRLRSHYAYSCFLEDHTRSDKPFVIVNGTNYYPKGAE